MRKVSFKFLIAVIIIGLGTTYAAMHWSFTIPFESTQKNIDFQISLTQGMHPNEPDTQSRILFPFLVKILNLLVKRPFWIMFFAESICAIFAYASFFSLSQVLIREKRYALLSTLFVAVFTPYALQFEQRYGELFILGFYSVLLFLIIRQKWFWYILFLVLASFQRPDIALASVFFKFLHTLIVRRKILQIFYDAVLLCIPMLIVFFISRYYGLLNAGYKEAYVKWIFIRPVENIKALRFILMMYLPIFILAFTAFSGFSRMIKIILVSLVPYLVILLFLSSFGESRLLMPLFAVLIIGIIGWLKDSKVLITSKDITDNNCF